MSETILHLALQWDAILTIPDVKEKKPALRCMVSSSILASQAPYFRGLLRSGFREGIAVQNGEKPEIFLKGDDPNAMGIILSILHDRIEPRYTDLSPPEIVSIAQHYDKYSCNGIMSTWIEIWLFTLFRRAEPCEIGTCVAVAWLFRSPTFVVGFVKMFIEKHRELFVDNAMLHMQFGTGQGWTEDAIPIPSDIRYLFLQRAARISSEMTAMMQATQKEFEFDPVGPEYLIALEKYKIWPFAPPAGLISSLLANLEAAARDEDVIRYPKCHTAIQELQNKIKDLATREKSLGGADVVLTLFRTQSLQAMLRSNEDPITRDRDGRESKAGYIIEATGDGKPSDIPKIHSP